MEPIPTESLVGGLFKERKEGCSIVVGIFRLHSGQTTLAC